MYIYIYVCIYISVLCIFQISHFQAAVVDVDSRSNSLHRGHHITPRSRDRINEVETLSQKRLRCSNLCLKSPLINSYFGHDWIQHFKKKHTHIWKMRICLLYLKQNLLFRNKSTEKQSNNCVLVIISGLQTQTCWSPQVVTVDVPKSSKLVIYFCCLQANTVI